MKTVCRQRGVALITALLIVALAAMMASSLITAQNLGLHRSSNLYSLEQSSWYARGAEVWAGRILKKDRQDNSFDAPSEPWAQALNYIPVDGGTLSGALSDAQSRFNLNNLTATNAEGAEKMLQRILDQLQTVDSFDPAAVVQSIHDWVDADSEPRFPGGAEDDFYQSQRDLPYRAANRPFTSVTELRLVRGITPKLYRALLPFVTALPIPTPVNVNSASAVVLAALAEDVQSQTLVELMKIRELKPFETLSGFITDPAFAGRTIDQDQTSVISHFFELKVKAEVGNSKLTLYSLLFRGDNGQVQVTRHNRDTL